MEKNYLIIILLLLAIPTNIYAKSGCCSHHRGVAGCSSNGRQICNDGSLSPSCTCVAVSNIYGCTDYSAKNYNYNANVDDGTCEYYVYGCTDINAYNYDINAQKDDGSCEYKDELIEAESNSINNSSDNNDSDSEGVGLAILGVGTITGVIAKFKKK